MDAAPMTTVWVAAGRNSFHLAFTAQLNSTTPLGESPGAHCLGISCCRQESGQTGIVLAVRREIPTKQGDRSEQLVDALRLSIGSVAARPNLNCRHRAITVAFVPWRKVARDETGGATAFSHVVTLWRARETTQKQFSLTMCTDRRRRCAGYPQQPKGTEPVKKTVQIVALASLLTSFAAVAHHPAADIVDEETFEMIDENVADTPHADLEFDDMGR
jgi:hypothetical protein